MACKLYLFIHTYLNLQGRAEKVLKKVRGIHRKIKMESQQPTEILEHIFKQFCDLKSLTKYLIPAENGGKL